MKAASKSVLFTRVVIDKHPRLWPVAVFATSSKAQAFYVALKAAWATGDPVKVKALDPSVILLPDETLPADPKFSIRDLPYEPDVPTAPADDLDTSSSSIL